MSSDHENESPAEAGFESPEASGSQSASNASPEASSDSPASVDEVFEELTAGLGEVQSKEAELLNDLQRLQAEFVNYKARVERDRDVSRNNAIAEVLRAFLPALDDLSRAEAHGDLEGSPFAAVANKLRSAGEKFGLKSFAAKGDAFNPELHDALVQTPSAEVTQNTVADVVEPGYLLGERVIRAAKVAVFIPAE
jgi:molecular chaperone GrpE